MQNQLRWMGSGNSEFADPHSFHKIFGPMKNLAEKQALLVLVEKFLKKSSKTLLPAVSKLNFYEIFSDSAVASNSG